MSTKKPPHIIRLDRDTEDHILPKDFFDILVHRFFPVISMTYIGSIIGIALSKGNFIHYMFFDRTAYMMALFVVVWVSGPALTWIFLRGSPLFHHVADIWYKILAGLMVVTITLSFVLFPEGDMFGLRFYFVLSVPVFVLIYYFFVRGGLPPFAAYPLNALGVCLLLYGAAVNLIF